MSAYTIKTVGDLLKIPADRRSECFRQMEYALALHELAYGDLSLDFGIDEITWTDDGDMSAHLKNEAGEAIMTLSLTEGGREA